MIERAPQVRHGQALCHRKPLDLVKHRRVRRVELVRAEYLAGTDDVQRKLALEHRPDLNRGGVGPQDQPGVRRAGWSAPRLSASKLNHSDSTSGPSAISQPMATKMSPMRSEMSSSAMHV